MVQLLVYMYDDMMICLIARNMDDFKQDSQCTVT